MKANELRLGNYIRHTNNNGTFKVQVVGITPKGIKVKYLAGIWTLAPNELSPIPLTEELLLSAGFVNDTEHVYGYKSQLSDIVFDRPNNWDMIDDYDTGIYTVTNYIGYNPIIIRCLYLHQLQNMVFAITGEELDIELL